MLRFGNHVVEEEERGLAQHGIGACAQELNVGVEGVMVPHLQRDPDARRDEDAPADSSGRRVAPGICHRVHHPSGRVVHLSRGGAARCAHHVDEREERRLALREVAHLGGPVVLLRVDVEVEVVGPAHAAGEPVVPDALQCERQWRVGARAGDGQVAPVLKEEREQFRIVCAILKRLAARVGRQPASSGCALPQVERRGGRATDDRQRGFGEASRRG